jgi:uncharacterized protein (TIGR00375 family)
VLISNSDCHSPQKIGREANVFETEFNYNGIINALKGENNKRLLYTIEFFPEEGKYHYDGHRTCKLSFKPKQSKKYKNICPKCGKPLVIGVLNRVEQLADRPEGFVPKKANTFKSLIPLQEIISEILGASVFSKKVLKYYNNLIKNVGNEFEILLKVSQKEIEKNSLPEIAKAILKVRKGNIKINPGYDGVYGKIEIF